MYICIVREKKIISCWTFALSIAGLFFSSLPKVARPAARVIDIVININA